jgi:hypothetical protein
LAKLRKILIITPHYPPSNLAAVHRSRLFAQHLPSFGWDPIILTVDERDYEETMDWNLHALLPKNQNIEKVRAFPVTKPRLIGDIGLRALFQLRKRALELVKSEHIEFVYIPIPSFYVALIGPYLHRKTGVKYGIDYIDPWVHRFPGSDKLLSRHWFSMHLAKLLEPKAVKYASLITGVAEGYYQGVVDRNPQLKESTVFAAMPYGGEIEDHEGLKKLNVEPYLFRKNGKFQFVYAGAMLPNAYGPLEAIFKAISSRKMQFGDVEFHFIGTGFLSNDPHSYNIKPLAEKYGLWESIVFEYPKRIPYLDVLVHLEIANAVFILGSTEPHYTPSKTYQGVLSQKPIFAILHEKSSAAIVLKETNSGQSLCFNGEIDLRKIEDDFESSFMEFQRFTMEFNHSQVNHDLFEEYSAKSVTKKLAHALNSVFR